MFLKLVKDQVQWMLRIDWNKIGQVLIKGFIKVQILILICQW